MVLLSVWKKTEEKMNYLLTSNSDNTSGQVECISLNEEGIKICFSYANHLKDPVPGPLNKQGYFIQARTNNWYRVWINTLDESTIRKIIAKLNNLPSRQIKLSFAN